jgi:hypothetical protein
MFDSQPPDRGNDHRRGEICSGAASDVRHEWQGTRESFLNPVGLARGIAKYRAVCAVSIAEQGVELNPWRPTLASRRSSGTELALTNSRQQAPPGLR